MGYSRWAENFYVFLGKSEGCDGGNGAGRVSDEDDRTLPLDDFEVDLKSERYKTNLSYLIIGKIR